MSNRNHEYISFHKQMKPRFKLTALALMAIDRLQPLPGLPGMASGGSSGGRTLSLLLLLLLHRSLSSIFLNNTKGCLKTHFLVSASSPPLLILLSRVLSNSVPAPSSTVVCWELSRLTLLTSFPTAPAGCWLPLWNAGCLLGEVSGCWVSDGGWLRDTPGEELTEEMVVHWEESGR